MSSFVPRVVASNDRTLIARVRDGEAAAFQELFTTYFPACYRFALSFVADVDVAEDMVQELFAWLWTHRATWDPKSDILSYFLAAVRNRALVTARNARRRTGATVRFIAPGESPALGTQDRAVDAAVEARDLADLVWRVIQELPEQRRTVLLLRWRHEMAWDAIARIMELSIPAARMLHSRALQSLRDRLLTSF